MSADQITTPASPGWNAFQAQHRTTRKPRNPRVNDRVNVVPSALWGLNLNSAVKVLAATVTGLVTVDGQEIVAVLAFLPTGQVLPLAGLPQDETRQQAGSWHFAE